jgi:hypothetical protein
VSRALKRLRDQLRRKGIKVATVAAILSLLMHSSSTARAAAVARGGSLVQFARIATGQSEAAGRSLQIVQATLKTIAGGQVRLLAAITGAALSLTVAVGVFTPVLGQIVHPVLSGVESALTWSTPRSLTFQQPPEPSPTLPSPPQQDQTRLWVGSSNDRAWPVLPRSAPAIPLELRSLSGVDTPVAVAQDHLGQLWYRHLDPPAVDHAGSDELGARSYEELNPYLAVMPDDSLVTLLPEDWMSAPHVSRDGVMWQPLDPPSEGGYVVLPFTQLNPGDGADALKQLQVTVPEPALLALSTAAAALLMCRRRR